MKFVKQGTFYLITNNKSKNNQLKWQKWSGLHKVNFIFMRIGHT